MKARNIICALLLSSFFIFNVAGCKADSKIDSKIEGVITEYVNTYYTITKDDIELYRRIIGGYKDINSLNSDTNKANERFKNLMTDTAYDEVVNSLISYRRCKDASENNYYVAVKSIKLEKYAEDANRKVYYYYIELIQTPTAGGEGKIIEDRKQITVSQVNGEWKVSNSYLNRY